MNRKKKERLAKELNEAEKDVQEALEQFNGNPATERALKSLNRKIEAVSEGLNLDISGGDA